MRRNNNHPVGIGLVGCGDLGNMVLPHFEQADARARARIVAVCDNEPEKVETARQRYNVPAGYTDYGGLLADENVELVLLLLPMQLHAPFALRALAAGKHIYVQKAMTATLAEADELVEAVRASGLKAGAAPGQMFAPFFRETARLVREGTLGHVFWTFTNNAGRGSEYPWYLREGGGPLNTVTVYSLAALTGVFGPARYVTALSATVVPEATVPAGTMRRECDDNTLILLDFGDGLFAFANGCDAVVPHSLQWGQFAVAGEKASLESGAIHMPSGWPVELILKERGKSPLRIPVPIADLPCLNGTHADLLEPHVYADIMHMVDCIVDDTEPAISVEHGRHVVEIIEKAYESARAGTRRELHTRF